MSTRLEAIRSALDRLAGAWKTNDGAAVASSFVPDGTLINPFGQRADGRGAIAAMYTEHFAGMLRGTSTTLELAGVRVVEREHALADADQTIRDRDGKVVLTVHLVALLRRDGDDWHFADARPYAFATPPS
jgi:uncharacterized protein (TIGR02246 family)